MVNDALIENQTVHSARTVFAPKVNGTSNILAIAGREPVAAIKLFSSVAASLGSGGQANYAAANAVMDSCAAQSQNQVSLSDRYSAYVMITFNSEERNLCAKICMLYI